MVFLTKFIKRGDLTYENLRDKGLLHFNPCKKKMRFNRFSALIFSIAGRPLSKSASQAE